MSRTKIFVRASYRNAKSTPLNPISYAAPSPITAQTGFFDANEAPNATSAVSSNNELVQKMSLSAKGYDPCSPRYIKGHPVPYIIFKGYFNYSKTTLHNVSIKPTSPHPEHAECAFSVYGANYNAFSDKFFVFGNLFP